ncbi:hypothetical protein D3C86_1986080 [compost metagenome]
MVAIAIETTFTFKILHHLGDQFHSEGARALLPGHTRSIVGKGKPNMITVPTTGDVKRRRGILGKGILT